MLNMASPGIKSTELDLSYTVQSVAGVSGAFVGAFLWGPVEEVLNVTDGTPGMVQRFFQPDNNTAIYWLSVRDYLIYNNSAKVVRLVGASAVNAVPTGETALLVKNESHYDTLTLTGLSVIAKYPGSLGNALAVHAADSVGFTGWAYADDFEFAPAAGQFNMVVVDTTGAWSGTAGTVLEKYELMTNVAGSKKTDGSSAYVKDVVNRGSNYVWIGDIDAMYFLQEATAAEIVSGGSGYTAADTLTVTGGTGTSATITVDTVDGSGVITGITVATGGSYSDIPTNPVSVTGGTGTGATFNLTFASITGLFDATLQGGVDDNTLTSHVTGWNLFDNPSTTDVWELVAVNQATADIDALVTIAEGRGDCVGFFSPPLAAVLNNVGSEVTDIVTYRSTTTNKNSSYLMMDDNWKQVYDEFNDLYRWIPMAPSNAGLHAVTVNSSQPWQSHAGYTRGKVKNIIRLAWNSNEAYRNTLYKIGVNSFISEPGEGVVLYGDKVQVQNPTAFSRINVRNLFIVMRKAVSRAAKYQLFELNDSITRSLFRNRVSAYLQGVQAGRGVYDYRVVCDESNNTAEVIDANEFIASIFVKPARSINFIGLNFVAVASGVDFTEIENAI